VEVVGHDRSRQVIDALNSLPISSATGAEEDGTTSAKVFMAYRFTPNWSLELSYQDLGDTSGFFSAVSDNGNIVEGSLHSDYQAFAFAVLGRWPIGHKFSLLGKVGIHRWQHEFDLKATDTSNSNTDSGSGLLYAVGIEYPVSTHWVVRIEWERFDNIEDKDGIDVKGITLAYLF